MNVAAVIVTRGDVDLAPVLRSLPSDWAHVVWDNSRGVSVRWPSGHVWVLLIEGEIDLGLGGPRPTHDLAVYGRYAAIAHALDSDVIYVQDDDCILAPESFDALLIAYRPGHIVANMPERFRPHYPDSCLVGFGAIFDRDLPARAFEQIGLHDYVSPFPEDTGWWNLRHTVNGVMVEIPSAAFFHRTCDVVFTTLTPRILLDLDYADREFASAPNRMWKQPGHHAERQAMLKLARQVRDRVTA